MSIDQPGHAHKNWNIDISIDEHDGHTRAKARLHWRDQESVGVGLAKRNSADREVVEIGDELAVARALRDLANRVMAVTVHDIEAVTNKPVTSLF